MARPGKYKSPTRAVRLPEHAIPLCEALARQLDEQANVQNALGHMAEPPGPYVVSIETYAEGLQQYLIQPDPNTDFSTWIEADLLANELLNRFPTQKERMYLLSRLAQEWATKI